MVDKLIYGGFGFGLGWTLALALSSVLWYIWSKDLVEKIYTMKKQGFVPQYTFEQRSTIDPAEDVVEY